MAFNQKPCPLLSGNQCSAYAFRPDDCREFPHLQKEGFYWRLGRVVQNCSICPIVFNVYERLKEELWHAPGGARDEALEWEDFIGQGSDET